ncbi:MAG: hypothetical protein MRJ93_05050 [Nitrososphaeraceae archaeon]|nr:hypothetical protein [Nitrososphaeraceae archaeon]
MSSLMIGTTNMMLPQIVNAQKYISNPNPYEYDYQRYLKTNAQENYDNVYYPPANKIPTNGPPAPPSQSSYLGKQSPLPEKDPVNQCEKCFLYYLNFLNSGGDNVYQDVTTQEFMNAFAEAVDVSIPKKGEQVVDLWKLSEKIDEELAKLDSTEERIDYLIDTGLKVYEDLDQEPLVKSVIKCLIETMLEVHGKDDMPKQMNDFKQETTDNKYYKNYDKKQPYKKQPFAMTENDKNYDKKQPYKKQPFAMTENDKNYDKKQPYKKQPFAMTENDKNYDKKQPYKKQPFAMTENDKNYDKKQPYKKQPFAMTENDKNYDKKQPYKKQPFAMTEKSSSQNKDKNEKTIKMSREDENYKQQYNQKPFSMTEKSSSQNKDIIDEKPTELQISSQPEIFNMVPFPSGPLLNMPIK